MRISSTPDFQSGPVHLNITRPSCQPNGRIVAGPSEPADLSTMKRLLPIVLFIQLAFSCLDAGAQLVPPVKITPQNALNYREALTMLVFGSNSLPADILPDTLISNVNSIDQFSTFPYSSIYYPAGNLDSIDKILVTIDTSTVLFPEKARIYLFHPHQSNGKLFIYHAGHCAATAVTEDIIANNGGAYPGMVIPRMIAEGYTVLAVPSIHYRNIPPAGYICGYNGHHELFAEGGFLHPLGLFFKPVLASLNFLGRSNYQEIVMCGLSGGGWATSVYPALDSSIRVSFPVAGSWPMAVRHYFDNSYGDDEQTYPPLTHLLDYHDLYTLSCLSPARKMVQINNRYDPCCFNGSTAHIFYADSVKKALGNSGGDFRFYLDEFSNGHMVSSKALDIICAFLRNERAGLSSLPEDTLTSGNDYYFNIQEAFNASPSSPGNTLTYSLLKAPRWLNLNNTTGVLSGTLPVNEVISGRDSISFKVEDSNGRFVLHSHTLVHGRPGPYLFTMNNTDSLLYWLPEYSCSLSQADQRSLRFFYFNNPDLAVTQISILNGSVVQLRVNRPLQPGDSIGYAGNGADYAITYNNGRKASDFGLTPVRLNIVPEHFARPGMIRFNTDTRKFEYFNGIQWIDMH